MSEVEFLQLSNGRYVADENISHVLQHLKSIKPERTYQDDSTGYSWDEMGMAELFSEIYRETTRYCVEFKCWFTYAEGKWHRDESTCYVSAKIKEFSRIMALYSGEITDDDIRQKYQKFLAKMGDRRFRDRMLKDSADNLIIHADEFDRHPNLINCQNGTFDLNTFKFYEHNPADLLTMQTRVCYQVNYREAACPRWKQFIREIMQNDMVKADYLQRALGYSLLGTAKEDCMFLLYGTTTRNGKSTMLGTIEYLLGDYASAAPVTLICGKDDTDTADAPKPVLASLKGKRFVTMAESKAGKRLNENILKIYTGGDSITARELYKGSFTYVPQFTLFLSCNHLPTVYDKSVFASDRLRVIEFNRHFSEAEQDKDLKDFFRSPDSMAGILTWLIEGYSLYIKKGLGIPEPVRRAIRQYEKENDLMWMFLGECTERASEGKIRASSLYEHYKIWSRNNGYSVMSSKTFNQELDRHPDFYDGIIKPANVKTITGLKLVQV